jgi:hypothetical protein
MIYEKLAIITRNLEESHKIIDLFNPYMAVNTYLLLCNDIILLDTCNGINDWKEIIDKELSISVLITEIEKLKFCESEYNVLNEAKLKFIKDADISDDIDYFLDLIIEKGNLYFLGAKEMQRLMELSKSI